MAENTKHVRLWDLRTNSCRWPLGEPSEQAEFLCGEPAIPGGRTAASIENGLSRHGRPSAPSRWLSRIAADSSGCRDRRRIAASWSQARRGLRGGRDIYARACLPSAGAPQQRSLL